MHIRFDLALQIRSSFLSKIDLQETGNARIFPGTLHEFVESDAVVAILVQLLEH